MTQSVAQAANSPLINDSDEAEEQLGAIGDTRFEAAPPSKPHWLNIAFLGSVHLIAVVGFILYAALHGVTWTAAGLCLAWMALTIFSLSAGYHRLFSHRAYEAHPALKLLLLCFGAASFQNSALTWAADHRRHHRKVDTNYDPYNAKRGFWFSHIGWVLRKGLPAWNFHPVPDLDNDRLVTWQHRHYMAIGTFFGLILPAAVGWMLGDFWGGLIVGGFVRLVFVYHITFSVNSFAHILGSQPWSDRSTARDSFVVAFLSMGEGYHNFHHTFPADYRNGVRAWHFDPSKWTIRALSLVGLTRNLKRTPREAMHRARDRMTERRLAR